MSAPDVSVVVPLYQEAENVDDLIDAVAAALPASLQWELILVDDGSRDATFAHARRRVQTDARIRALRLRRNYGQTAAMAAGIGIARGRSIVTMDGDLQNDPADIPRLLARLEQGFDLVAGWRRRRQDAPLRVWMSQCANRLIAGVMGAPVRDTGCSLKAFRAHLVQSLPLYGDMHRFIPAISRLAGARIAQMEVNHRPRSAGQSKYGFSRIWKVGLDIVSIRALLWHARWPLRGSLLVGAAVAASGLAIVGGVALAEPPLAIVPGTLGVLAVSLGVVIGAGGLLGAVYRASHGEAACFASVSARVYLPEAELRHDAEDHSVTR